MKDTTNYFSTHQYLQITGLEYHEARSRYFHISVPPGNHGLGRTKHAARKIDTHAFRNLHNGLRRFDEAWRFGQDVEIDVLEDVAMFVAGVTLQDLSVSFAEVGVKNLIPLDDTTIIWEIWNDKICRDFEIFLLLFWYNPVSVSVYSFGTIHYQFQFKYTGLVQFVISFSFSSSIQF